MKNKFIKKIITSGLTLTLCFSSYSLVFAQSTGDYDNIINMESWYDISLSSELLTINDGDILDISNLEEYANTVIKVPANSSVRIIGDPKKTYTDLNIYCEPNVSLSLNDVNMVGKSDITNKGTYYSGAISFTGGQNQLLLSGNNTVTYPNTNDNTGANVDDFGAAIKVPEGTSLKITESNDSYEQHYLKAVGNDGGAAIGAGYNKNAGKIYIENVKIDAQGDGAGIGGGSGSINGGNSTEISITDATVTATGKNGAGIGGGAAVCSSYNGTNTYTGGKSGITNITNSTIVATGEKGAGIGGGMADISHALEYKIYGGAIGKTTIKSSVVTATGKNGAGIGGGAANLTSDKNIKTPNYAYGGGFTKEDPESGKITIDCDYRDVIAVGNGGAGIGGGMAYAKGDNVYTFGGEIREINILNGAITSTGHKGAGLGGGNAESYGFTNSTATGGNGGNITISNGNIHANAHQYSAGIGGGGGFTYGIKSTNTTGGNGGITKISNGKVNIDTNKTEIGAGIGGGMAISENNINATSLVLKGGNGGETLISGGMIDIENAGGKCRSAGIGGGGVSTPTFSNDMTAGNGGNIAIINSALVEVNACSYARNFGGGSVQSPKAEVNAIINDDGTQIFVASSVNYAISPDTIAYPETDSRHYMESATATFQTNGNANPKGSYSVKNPFTNSKLGDTFQLGTPSKNSTMYVDYYGINPPSFTFSLQGYPSVKSNFDNKLDVVVNFIK